MARYWWVNQGQSYGAERAEGILWAPMRTVDGRATRSHWENMDQVNVGDVVLHYAAQRVQAISTVTAGCVPSRRPGSLPTKMWEQDGRVVRAEYGDASNPVHRTELPEVWRVDEPSEGPFRTDGGVKLGYLFPLSDAFFRRFDLRFGHRFPAHSPLLNSVEFVPAEARENAGDLLRRLIGVPLRTAAGSANTILGVQGDQVIVATRRSTDGQNVPVQDVQRALDILVETGAITIHPDEVGYRSAFIGAVLSTLPGARIGGSSPPVLRLTDTFPGADGVALNASEDGDDLTFEGDLMGPPGVVTRGEQAKLRRQLFGSSTSANCALCGEKYPVRFLCAAHIKKRALCSDQERRDLSHIAMPACVFGCDALYESGYIAVDETGHIQVSHSDEPAMIRRLSLLEGRGCFAFTEKSSVYFSWHRENVWRG